VSGEVPAAGEGPEPVAPQRGGDDNPGSHNGTAHLNGSNGVVKLDLARQRELVERQRAELGRTIAALGEKIDVPARTKAAAKSAKARVGASARRLGDPEYVLAGVAAACTAVAVFAFTSWWRGRPRP
jgi:hypothetical protein